MKVLLTGEVVYGEQSGSSRPPENHLQYCVTAIEFLPNGRRAAESASVVDALAVADAIGSYYEATYCAAAMRTAGRGGTVGVVSSDRAQVDPQGGR
jgi:hypothetical protein